MTRMLIHAIAQNSPGGSWNAEPEKTVGMYAFSLYRKPGGYLDAVRGEWASKRSATRGW